MGSPELDAETEFGVQGLMRDQPPVKEKEFRIGQVKLCSWPDKTLASPGNVWGEYCLSRYSLLEPNSWTFIFPPCSVTGFRLPWDPALQCSRRPRSSWQLKVICDPNSTWLARTFSLERALGVISTCLATQASYLKLLLLATRICESER